MDFVLIQKRIAILEEAITVLLDSHHLKGIYLVHNLTQDQAEKCDKSYRFRDRVVSYINKYLRDDLAGRRGSEISDKNSNEQ